MPPRGLKALLKKTAPARLRRGRRQAFVTKGSPKSVLRGLTKCLERKLFSSGRMPESVLRGGVRRGGWQGQGGGRRRGAAVDAQVSNLVNRGCTKPKGSQYKLTKLTLAALSAHNLEPVCAQRAVCNAALRIGTAIDVLCYDTESNCLTVVELKCGHSGCKTTAAELSNGTIRCNMKAPMSHTADSTLNRHMAQLACTRQLFINEEDTLARVASLGVDAQVDGALLYVDDSGAQLFHLHEWWRKRAHKMVASICAR